MRISGRQHVCFIAMRLDPGCVNVERFGETAAAAAAAGGRAVMWGAVYAGGILYVYLGA